MASVTVWKQPYSPGDAPLGTFSLERAAAMAGLTPTWLDFVLLNAKRATGIWDTAAWHIEGAARKLRGPAQLRQQHQQASSPKHHEVIGARH